MTAQERAQLFDELADAAEGRLTRHATSLMDRVLEQEPGPARIVDADACQKIAESLHRLPGLAAKLARDHAAAVRIAGQERAPQERLTRASDVLEVAQTLRRAAEALLDELEPSAEQAADLEGAVNTSLAQLVPLRELHPRAIRGAYELEAGCLSAAARLLQTTRFTVWRVVGERAAAHRERQAQRKRALRRASTPSAPPAPGAPPVQQLPPLCFGCEAEPADREVGGVPMCRGCAAGLLAREAVEAEQVTPDAPTVARYGTGNGRKPPHWHQLRQLATQAGDYGPKGLCGARPSYRSSATWEYAPAGQAPTCPTCLRILEAGEEQTQEGVTP